MAVLVSCLKGLQVACVVWCPELDPVCCGEGWLASFWFWLSWTPCVPEFLTDGPHHS